MPVNSEQDALDWARREHAVIERMRELTRAFGANRTWSQLEKDSLRKRHLALMDVKRFSGDPNVPVAGSDDDIAAFLSVKREPTRPSARALVDAAARRAGGAA